VERNQLVIYDTLKEFLSGINPASYREIADRLQISEPMVKFSIHKLRRKFQKAVEAEVAHTVETPDQIADEMRFLFDSLKR
jgi:predicted ArsR family transcriptional regulator